MADAGSGTSRRVKTLNWPHLSRDHGSLELAGFVLFSVRVSILPSPDTRLHLQYCNPRAYFTASFEPSITTPSPEPPAARCAPAGAGNRVQRLRTRQHQPSTPARSQSTIHSSLSSTTMVKNSAQSGRAKLCRATCGRFAIGAFIVRWTGVRVCLYIVGCVGGKKLVVSASAQAVVKRDAQIFASQI